MKKLDKYVIAVTSSASDLIPRAEHIERNEEYKFKGSKIYTDFDAGLDAKKDGIKLIDDIDGIYKDLYIDTPQNRQIIEAYISEHPQEVGRCLIGKFD